MLEFNEQHKSADLSTIKPKLDRAKHIGKVAICGIMISATLLLSGCGRTNEQSYETIEPQITQTAIVMENGNALIIDTKKISDGGYSTSTQIFKITTTSGEQLLEAVENIHIIEGENSREIAEKMAESLIDENGKITYYEDIVDLGRSR